MTGPCQQSDVTWAPWHPNLPVIRLLVQQLTQTIKSIKGQHHSSFERGFHTATGESPHKNPIQRKAIAFCYVIMLSSYAIMAFAGKNFFYYPSLGYQPPSNMGVLSYSIVVAVPRTTSSWSVGWQKCGYTRSRHVVVSVCQRRCAPRRGCKWNNS